MALNKREVVVLCPNGRRVTIKTSISTSIVQIIEESCLKQKFDPQEHNLKHLRRVLDPSSTLQYSNIPNRAQLELVQAQTRRQELNVTVNLVSETGERFIQDFPASCTLWEILLHHENNPDNNFCLPLASSDSVPFIVYTMRKIIGEELKSVTLKSLGLYGSRCMMRYNIENRQPEVSSAVTSLPVIVKNNTILSKSEIIEEKSVGDNKSIDTDDKEMDWDPVTQVDSAGEERIVKVESSCIKDEFLISDMKASNAETTSATFLPQVQADDVGTLDDKPEQESGSYSILKRASSTTLEDQNNDLTREKTLDYENTEKDSESEQKPTSNIIPLSGHNSILFSLDDAPTTASIEESECFFDLTLDEVRRLHHDLVKQIREMEDAPLMTNQLREFEKDSRLLSAMNRHPITQLRICFPDRHVIQADFKPRNAVQDVMEFLKPFLVPSDLKFYLYTTFPKRVLDPEISLVEAGCIPKARLYFGSDEDLPTFLSDETLSKKSTFEAAARAVVKSRIRSEDKPNSSNPEKSVSTKSESNVLNDSSRKPKWFKLGK